MSYRQPLWLLTDDEYVALGVIAEQDGRFVGFDTSGRKLFSRASVSDAVRAGKSHGNLVSSAWYGVSAYTERTA